MSARAEHTSAARAPDAPDAPDAPAAAAAAAVSVRDARREDLPAIYRMIHELAAYEGMPEGPQISAEGLAEDGFDSSPPWFFALVAECEGELVGYALCNRAYSSWTRRALYLEDLYVRAERRGAGVGRQLLRALCLRACACGATRVDWHVLRRNRPARALYARCGARDLHRDEDRLPLRLDEHRIRAVADGHFLPGDLLPDDLL